MVIYIFMNGILIGELEKSQKSGLIFTYDKDWIVTPGARPISLSLPLAEQPFIGDSVYNFFDNLLPDNLQIRARIQSKFRIPTSHPFDLLACIGKDCVGAIQMTDEISPKFSKEIKFCTIDSEKISHILKDYQNSPLGMAGDVEDFRISIAGAQEKAAFLFHKNKWHIPLGETPTTHIFKLPIGFIKHQNMDLSDSCENEWLCSKIIGAFGLPVSNCEIHTFEDVKVLVVERFDRKLSHDKKWIMRLPQEDMCQALGDIAKFKLPSGWRPWHKRHHAVIAWISFA